jgi:hypothetical protein
MILVFKTTVKNNNSVKKLKPLLDRQLTNSKWNFDLDDCDKILRIETPMENSDLVISLLKENGFDCEELLD